MNNRWHAGTTSLSVVVASEKEAMKNALALGLLLGLLSLCLAVGQQRSAASSVEDQIKRLEQDWAQAVVKEGGASVDQYEADDIVTTDPSNRVTGKAEDKTDLSSVRLQNPIPRA